MKKILFVLFAVISVSVQAQTSKPFKSVITDSIVARVDSMLFIKGHMVPQNDSIFTLGNDTLPWKAGYIDSLNSVKVIADTIEVDVMLGNYIQQGTYLPDDSAATNTDAVVLDSVFYTKVGDVVTVSGVFEIDPTTTLTDTYFYMSVPIDRDTDGEFFWVAGFFNAYQFNEHGSVSFVTGTNRVIFQFVPTDVNSRFMNFSFQYKLR